MAGLQEYLPAQSQASQDSRNYPYAPQNQNLNYLDQNVENHNPFQNNFSANQKPVDLPSSGRQRNQNVAESQLFRIETMGSVFQEPHIRPPAHVRFPNFQNPDSPTNGIQKNFLECHINKPVILSDDDVPEDRDEFEEEALSNLKRDSNNNLEKVEENQTTKSQLFKESIQLQNPGEELNDKEIYKRARLKYKKNSSALKQKIYILTSESTDEEAIDKIDSLVCQKKWGELSTYLREQSSKNKDWTSNKQLLNDIIKKTEEVEKLENTSNVKESALRKTMLENPTRYSWSPTRESTHQPHRESHHTHYKHTALGKELYENRADSPNLAMLSRGNCEMIAGHYSDCRASIEKKYLPYLPSIFEFSETLVSRCLHPQAIGPLEISQAKTIAYNHAISRYNKRDKEQKDILTAIKTVEKNCEEKTALVSTLNHIGTGALTRPDKVQRELEKAKIEEIEKKDKKLEEGNYFKTLNLKPAWKNAVEKGGKEGGG